mgnify:CR=1 FL=1
MKAKWFPLFALVAVVGLSGCDSCTCEPVVQPVEKRVVRDLQINEWKYSGTDNNNYFFASFTIPEITSNVYNNGNIAIYREIDSGTVNAIQTLLPYVRHKEYLKDEANKEWAFYTETVDYEYGVGLVTIFYTVSDFDYELDTEFVPESMHFRLVLTW